jgi:hypothetical protein
MGGIFSTKVSETNSVKVLPESYKSNEEKIIIRHRPTCYSADLEKGITESTENFVQPDTKSP